MKRMLLPLMLLPVLLLGGCMLPEEARTDVTPYAEQLQSVQTAVGQYQETTGVLPIQTKPATTPLMERYPLDFMKLVPNYMADPPVNSFEGGGVFVYVLVDVETEPTVKLIDLRVAERLQQLQTKINTYQVKYKKYPFKGSLGKNQFTLDYDKLFLDEIPTIPSPYSERMLDIYVDGRGQLMVDYRPDLEDVVQKADGELEPGDDIRSLLYAESPFAPAYSQGYTVNEQGKVEFLNN